jgi:hypothetical protein
VSKVDILNELPRLSPEERQEVRLRLAELDREDWVDAGDLSDAQKALIEERCREMDANPGSSLSWIEARAQLLGAIQR